MRPLRYQVGTARNVQLQKRACAIAAGVHYEYSFQALVVLVMQTTSYARSTKHESTKHESTKHQVTNNSRLT